MAQVEEERKEAEAIKEKVAKDEAAVATRQEEVMTQRLSLAVRRDFDSACQRIAARVPPKFSSTSCSVLADLYQVFLTLLLCFVLLQ